MRINLFPCVVDHNEARRARLRRIREAELAERNRIPAWRRWLRLGGR